MTIGRLASLLDPPGVGGEAAADRGRPSVIGVIEGDGVGPDVIRAALHVLSAVPPPNGGQWQIRRGGTIGEAHEYRTGQALPDDVAHFCQRIFAEGGAVLSGPAGGRYVYDLRRRFDLFCKFVPIRRWPELDGVGPMKPEHTRGLDLLVVRDNIGGVYQGQWRYDAGADGATAEHTFTYAYAQVEPLIEVAARAAAARRGQLAVVIKDGGVPGISGLWRDVANTVAKRHGVQADMINVDLAAYQLVQHPRQFDVIVAPNLFGDILADIAAVLAGSRGLGFSGNFAAGGAAVYQTNHGCAKDIAGADRANPVGQILALTMLLRESFGLEYEAQLIERGVAAAWRAGWRTGDIAEPDCRVVGTLEMSRRIADAVAQFAVAEARA